MNSILKLALLIYLALFKVSHVVCFVPQRFPSRRMIARDTNSEILATSRHVITGSTPFGKGNGFSRRSTWELFSANDEALTTSDQVLLGGVGTFMSIVMLYSEFILKTTGCGLPAGPMGLIGATEGISYLGVSSIFLLSVYSKIKTVSEV